MICLSCGYPQFCPCPECLATHNQSYPFLWVWTSGNVCVCGYCGSPMGLNEDWAMMLDNLSGPAFYETINPT